MIPRYTREQIEKIWSLENKFSLWLKIEILVVEKLSINGIIPKKAAEDIKKNAFLMPKKLKQLKKKQNMTLYLL